MVRVEVEEDWCEREQEGWNQNVLFNADDGMVALSDPRWLRVEFSTLVGLFYRLGLRTNEGKTVGMVFHLFQAARNQSEAVYGRRMTGEGPSYREQQKVRVQCRECG